jgi:hypothetical protein
MIMLGCLWMPRVQVDEACTGALIMAVSEDHIEGIPRMRGQVGLGADPDPRTASVDARSTKSAANTHGTHPRALSERTNFWSTIITAITAAAALLLSGYTAIQLNSRPAMIVSMPKAVTFEVPSTGELRLIMQPTFYVYEKTDVTSVISDITLTPGTATVDSVDRTFDWTANVQWADSANPQFVYPTKYESEPGPLIVLQDSPKSPMLRFEAADRQPHLQSGRHEFTLTIERLKQNPIHVNFCVNISQSNLQSLTPPGEPGRSSFLYFRSFGSVSVEEADQYQSDCYGA